MGIDLEPIRALDRSLIEEAFSPDERALIERTAGDDRALMAVCYVSGWCAKEAVGKALGRGLEGQPGDKHAVPIVMHLVNGYLVPLLLYWIARQSPLRERGVVAATAALFCFGVYLAATGVLEFALAAAVLVPRYRKAVGWILIVMLGLFLPANVYAAIHRVPIGGHEAGPAYLLARVPMQGILAAWIWWYAIRETQPKTTDFAEVTSNAE